MQTKETGLKEALTIIESVKTVILKMRNEDYCEKLQENAKKLKGEAEEMCELVQKRKIISKVRFYND